MRTIVALELRNVAEFKSLFHCGRIDQSECLVRPILSIKKRDPWVICGKVFIHRTQDIRTLHARGEKLSEIVFAWLLLSGTQRKCPWPGTPCYPRR